MEEKDIQQIQNLSCEKIRVLKLTFEDWVEIHNSERFSKDQRMTALEIVDDYEKNYQQGIGIWIRLRESKDSTLLLCLLASMYLGRIPYIKVTSWNSKVTLYAALDCKPWHANSKFSPNVGNPNSTETEYRLRRAEKNNCKPWDLVY